MSKVKNKAWVIFGIIFFLVILRPQDLFIHQKNLQVIYMNIGQGDSSLIITPDNKKILIDGGPDRTVLSKLGKYMHYQNTLDCIFISHPHADHITGIVEALNHYHVGKVYLTDATIQTPEFDMLQRAFEKTHVPLEIITQPRTFYIGRDVKVNIFYPKHPMHDMPEAEVNDASMLVRFSYQETSFLFTGDLESTGQREVVNDEITSTILKVPHQGSIDSFDQAFVLAVHPLAAVVFVGKNSYGHPSARVLKAYKRVGIPVFITHNLGDIIMKTDGFHISMNSEFGDSRTLK